MLTAEPLSGARQPSVRTLTHEEEAVLQGQDGVWLEPTVMEEPSAALEFLQDLEYSRMVEARREEYPFALPTREDVVGSDSLFPPSSNTNTSTELALGTRMSGVETGGFNHLLDGWESWVELGCPNEK